MTPPILPFGSVIGIEAASNAGLRHTARQRIQVSADLPNREKAKTARWGEPICCLYRGINSTLADIAAAQGIEATGTLKTMRGQPIPAGSIWEVTTDDCDEPFVVQMTGNLVHRGSRVMRLVAVKDTQLDKP